MLVILFCHHHVSFLTLLPCLQSLSRCLSLKTREVWETHVTCHCPFCSPKNLCQMIHTRQGHLSQTSFFRRVHCVTRTANSRLAPLTIAPRIPRSHWACRKHARPHLKAAIPSFRRSSGRRVQEMFKSITSVNLKLKMHFSG